MHYEVTRLKREINVTGVYFVHYFEYGKNHSFNGETRDFWELVYVDMGELTIKTGDRRVFLKRGEMFFCEPNMIYTLRASGTLAPNIIVLGFECRSRVMQYFKGKLISLTDSEKRLLSDIIKEAEETFSLALNDNYPQKLSKRDDGLFGCEQMLCMSIEHLLISLRRNSDFIRNKSANIEAKRLTQDGVVAAVDFLENNIGKKLKFHEVAEFAGLSQSSLKTLFRTQIGQGVMSYFAEMKINRAKILIREGKYNITQISLILGYDSIHEFSRRFKKITGVSPTEYARSVKSESMIRIKK